jgi:hypothetical protein
MTRLLPFRCSLVCIYFPYMSLYFTLDVLYIVHQLGSFVSLERILLMNILFEPRSHDYLPLVSAPPRIDPHCIFHSIFSPPLPICYCYITDTLLLRYAYTTASVTLLLKT